MLTENDLKKIQEMMKVSNNELIKAFTTLHKRTFEKFNENLISFKDQILTEIKKIREDVTVVTGYKDQIENHETRITKLENVFKSS